MGLFVTRFCYSLLLQSTFLRLAIHFCEISENIRIMRKMKSVQRDILRHFIRISRMGWHLCEISKGFIVSFFFVVALMKCVIYLNEIQKLYNECFVYDVFRKNTRKIPAKCEIG